MLRWRIVKHQPKNTTFKDPASGLQLRTGSTKAASETACVFIGENRVNKERWYHAGEPSRAKLLGSLLVQLVAPWGRLTRKKA